MPERRITPQTLYAILLLLGAMVSIQSGAALAKSLFPSIGAEGTTAFRLGFSAILLTLIWRPWRYQLKLAHLRRIAAYGVVLGFMNLFFYLAIARIPLGIAIALEFSGPLAIAIYASKSRSDFLWTVVAIAGIGLILPLSGFAAPLDPFGIFFAFLAAICWALYIVFGQRVAESIPSGVVTSLGILAAAICVAPIGVVSAGEKMLDSTLWIFGVGVGIFSSAIPYTLEMMALRRLPARKFGILMSLEPAIGALSGLFFLGERLTLLQWFAIVLIVVASIGTARQPQYEE